MGNKEQKFLTFDYQVLKQWALTVLDKTGMDAKEMSDVIETLLSANLRGIETHGINLLRFYAERFRKIEIRDVSITKDFGAVVAINGGNHTGPYVGTMAMDTAIEKAEKFGVGLATVTDSSHFGAAGYYTLRAAKKGFIGFATTNAFSTLAPWGGIKTFMGNNPYSFSIPGPEFPIVMDIANSVTARQKLFLYEREGLALPEGWAMDKNGNPTTDPKEGIAGLLMPVGAHKGAGMAIIIDLLLAVLNNGGFSTGICQNTTPDKPMNVSHLFIAINPAVFWDKETRDKIVGDYTEELRNLPRKEGVDKLYLPGEPEWIKEQARLENGIPLSVEIVKELNTYAESIGVAPLK